jgi:hypothetical protein
MPDIMGKKRIPTRMVRVNLDLYKKLQEWAEEQERSASKEMNRILREFLRSVGKLPPEKGKK